MALGRLDITAVRNLASVSVDSLETINVFHGKNGSGKTSVLESVFLLGMTRSFRGGQIKTLIAQGEEQCTVYGEVQRDQGTAIGLGVSRDRDGGLQAKIGGEPVSAASELAEQLPLQVINAESFNLLTGSPSDRRQFLDWGVFHVEHGFYRSWQRFQRALKQRNALLRHGRIDTSDLAAWDRDLCKYGGRVDEYRSRYFQSLEPVFQNLVKRLSPDLDGLELRYRRGWDKSLTLEESLAGALQSDLQQGFTHSGPQRADIKVSIGGLGAGDVLSRGQQKLVVCALKLAQGQLLTETRRFACIYLVDDLPSELDRDHTRLVAEVLGELQTQVFITCVDDNELTDVWSGKGQLAMFHVEHGAVTGGT